MKCRTVRMQWKTTERNFILSEIPVLGLTNDLTYHLQAKKGTTKHTQSVSSADMQVRKISPRDQQAALQSRGELAQVMTRIIKQIEVISSSENNTLILNVVFLG